MQCIKYLLGIVNFIFVDKNLNMENSIETKEEKPSAQVKDFQKVNNSERKEKIFRAVIIWFTRDDRPEDREGLLEWFFTGNTKEATEYQLNTKRQLQEFLPALFENHDDDTTFADKNNRTPLHICISKMKASNLNDYTVNNADYELVCALCVLGMSIIALDNDGHSPLEIALTNNNENLMMKVLLNSDSINLADRNSLGQTVLHILIDKCVDFNDDYNEFREFIMKRLLRKGADINVADQCGVTAVHLAAKKLNITLLKQFLIQHEVDLNLRTNRGDDLLIIICKSLNKWQGDKLKPLQLVNYWLLSLRHFCTDAKNNNGFTALHYAALSENIEIIDRLIKAGAKSHDIANDDTNVLYTAAVSNNFRVMQYLIEKKGIDSFKCDNVYGFNLLHMAALNSEPRNCEWLVEERRCFVNDLGKYQLTPLHLASMLKNANVVKKLIEYGADLHRKDDKFHRTALHFASMRRRFVRIRDFRTDVEELAEQMNKLCSSSVEGIDDDDTSIVDYCFNHRKLINQEVNYKTTVVALLNAGAEVNATDSHGCTPLHYASAHTGQSYYDDFVLDLLNAGARVDVQDNKCLTPLEISFVSDNYNGFINLLTFGANINDIAHLIDCTFQDNRIFNSVENAVIKYAFQLKKAGLSIGELDNVNYIDFGLKNEKYDNDCSLELTKMKNRMLQDEVSLYDVLHMNFKQRSTFANILPRTIQNQFPNYYILLKGRCSEAVNRMALFNAARQAFEWVTGMHWPIICIDNILLFMSNRYLRVLIDAASEMD